MGRGWSAMPGISHTAPDSFVQLTGTQDIAAHQRFTLEDKITPATPPVFVWHTMEDETVPVENTLLLLSALHMAGVPCEVHPAVAVGAVGVHLRGGMAERYLFLPCLR